eukprot:1393270-Amorphochlora_amoeboformis.AAC.1
MLGGVTRDSRTGDGNGGARGWAAEVGEECTAFKAGGTYTYICCINPCVGDGEEIRGLRARSGMRRRRGREGRGRAKAGGRGWAQ